MLTGFKQRIVAGLLLAADVGGMALVGSGAVAGAFFGKFMLAVVLGAIALGFFLRISGRRRPVPALPPMPIPAWRRGVSAGLAAVEVAVLVEATSLPVRFDQHGFEVWHWGLVLVALAVAYGLNLRMLTSLLRRRDMPR